ncbi:UNVERIFIED_CONTAM: hypothetical protein Sradi_3606100 [Sesamum radiatum]|uniref:Uncharacterized protein n=1 Tax=Sesamum radiatum TaxID=300843 RepID=A0AAW2QH29_SESRA
MIEGSSVREHGVMMLSLVEKLKDLQANFEEEDTYVDYEAMVEKSASSVLVGEASTFKSKGKVVEREKRKKDETSCTASTSSALVTPLDGGEETRKRVPQSMIPNDVGIYCREKSHWQRKSPKLLSNKGYNDNEEQDLQSWQRNICLRVENAVRVMEAMRGVSFGTCVPNWESHVPKDQWIDQLWRLRKPLSATSATN